MENFLILAFVVSVLLATFLRFLLIHQIHRDKKLDASVGEIHSFRLSDGLAIRLLERFDLFPARLRILALIHFVAWAMAWILPFVLVAKEIFLR